MTKEFLNNQGDMKYGQLTADRLVVRTLIIF